ncbi:MAG: LD-carboxypeptidase [Flavobacteriales bacterium]|nr:LD-carboxypeptidase [Flavobacteriales bacterium]
MILPPFLKLGSKVRIVSTARKIEPEKINPSVSLLSSWGFEVSLGSNIFAEKNQFAGSDDLRINDLQTALDDPDINMIWCSRGGYGTVKLIDRLNFDAFLRHPKWIVGYSDITGLLTHITENFGVATIHGTMPINISDYPTPEQNESIQSLKNLLFGQTFCYKLPQHPLSRCGNAEGSLIGGNLSILYSILGSSSSPDTEDKILFIEDLDEYLYHIDRIMVNMKRNGKLSNLRALIVGGMSDMNDNAIPYGMSAEEIIYEHIKDFEYPVYFNFSAGHISPNLALPFGVCVKINENQLMSNHIGQNS